MNTKREVLTDWTASSVIATGRLEWKRAWFIGSKDRYNEYARWPQKVDLGDTAIICRRGVTWGQTATPMTPNPSTKSPSPKRCCASWNSTKKASPSTSSPGKDTPPGYDKAIRQATRAERGDTHGLSFGDTQVVLEALQ